MAKCGNCGAKLNCSCKMRKAGDGKSCCVSCVAAYNTQLKIKNRRTGANIKAVNTAPGVILNATAKQWIPDKE